MSEATILIKELMEKTEQWLLGQGYKKSTLGFYRATWNRFLSYSASPAYSRCEFSWRVIKCWRGGTDECKKAGKGGKGHESAIFNDAWTRMNAKFCKLAQCGLAKFFRPFWGKNGPAAGVARRAGASVWKAFKHCLSANQNKRIKYETTHFNRR